MYKCTNIFLFVQKSIEEQKTKIKEMTSEDDKNLTKTNELRLENIELKNDLHAIKTELKTSMDQLNDINAKVNNILNLLCL